MNYERWVTRGFDGDVEFQGRLLGSASSQLKVHKSHAGEKVAPAGVRCSACRWIEIRIFKKKTGEYVLELTGHTIVTGEKTRHRVEVTASPHWVIEVLTQRPDGRDPFIPRVAKHALSEAAASDPEMEFAYVARVVA
jgi:hypothetical protein